MKRLFQLRNTADGSTSQEYFDDKMKAKAKRQQLNPKDDAGKEKFVWVVTYGPDHDKYSKK